MKKNQVQDVIPPKKTIRNVEVPTRARSAQKSLKTSDLDAVSSENEMEVLSLKREAPGPFPKPKSPKSMETFSRPVSIKTPKNDPPPPPINKPPEYKYEYEEPKKPSRKGKYFALLLFFIIVAFGVSSFFRTAEIKVTPIEQSKTLNENFKASKNSTNGDLAFQVVTTSKDTERTVEGGSTVQVDKKATGTIIIYNNYSTQSQNLVATTRFETPEGLIYRLIKPVTVPGQQVKAGKTIAGSIEAVVEADKSGASYNIGLKDFTIPGLKNDPKYKFMYGRSKTEMTGGFSGMQKTVSKADLDKASLEMEAELKSVLAKDIINQIPENFVLYESSLSFSFDPVVQTPSSNGNVVLKKKGTTSAVIFDRSGLSKAVLAKILPDAAPDIIKVTNLPALKFTYDPKAIFDPNSSITVNFNLSGNADLVWVFDENKLKTDLLGLSKTNAKAVIGNYKAIKEAWITTHPFWNQTIPSDPAKVTLINTLTP